jgi:hypothetical protein
MGQSNAVSPNQFIEAPHAVASSTERAAKPTAADRLYQIAALAAGVFLLASLL